LYTLNFPVRLPPEHSYFDNAQYPIPPLPGGLFLNCIENEAAPLVLRVSGFASEEDAIKFSPVLKILLQAASLDSAHSFAPSGASALLSQSKHFNGDLPTVTPTMNAALPWHATASMKSGLHISVLSKLIAEHLTNGVAAKLNANSELALAVEMFSEFEFAGGPNAQFIMLLTALEVMIPATSRAGKRGAVIGLVKKALSAAGHADPKSVGKALDALYNNRNALVHEGVSVTLSKLAELKKIVQDTLKAMIKY
jgi:hypothetical protein